MTGGSVHRRIAADLGAVPVREVPLPGGCIADVRRIDLADGRTVAAKIAAQGGLEPEAWMLGYLAAQSPLPVPEVLLAADDLLVLSWLPCGGRLDRPAQRDAAAHVAALHAVTWTHFGLARDTLIGPLHQPNPATARWTDFFRDQRLLHMARVAREAGRLDAEAHRAVERVAAKLDGYLDEPAAPALIHGDMWGGNVLARGGRVTGFVDPAIYYADPEIELAFTTLFGTFGDAFFDAYAAHTGWDRTGFFEARRDLYNLYPLLVHAAAFGGPWDREAHAVAGRYA